MPIYLTGKVSSEWFNDLFKVRHRKLYRGRDSALSHTGLSEGLSLWGLSESLGGDGVERWGGRGEGVEFSWAGVQTVGLWALRTIGPIQSLPLHWCLVMATNSRRP